VGIERKPVRWVLDADLRGYTIPSRHEWLVKFIEHRIGDRRIVRFSADLANRRGAGARAVDAEVKKGHPREG